MNIDDVKTVEQYPDSIAAAIFTLQKQLMIRYDTIERRNGTDVPELPGHLDNRRIQQRLKDLFWRTTEELCEASEEILIHPASFHGLCDWQEVWHSDPSIRHFFEELIDSLHFLTEASIVAELGVERIQQLLNELDSTSNPEPGKIIANRANPLWLQVTYRKLLFTIIQFLGLAANCLKNKPWKETEMPTDSSKFRFYLYDAWAAFFDMWEALGGNSKMLYVLYTKKHTVNTWRQQTQY